VTNNSFKNLYLSKIYL